MLKRNPLLEEILAATLAMTAIEALVALLYWTFTGLSPWPFVVIAEAAAFGPGVALLSLTSPRRRP
jgi:hypothetical protein